MASEKSLSETLDTQEFHSPVATPTARTPVPSSLPAKTTSTKPQTQSGEKEKSKENTPPGIITRNQSNKSYQNKSAPVKSMTLPAESEKAQLMKKINTLQLEKSKLQRTKTQLESEKNALEEENRKQKGEIAQMEIKLKSTKSPTKVKADNTRDEEINTLKVAKITLENDLSFLEGEKMALKEDIEHQTSKTTKLEEKCKNLEKEKENLNEKIKELNAEKVTLQDKVKELETQRSTWQKTEESLKESVGDKDETINELKEKMDDLKKENQTKQDKIKYLEEKVDEHKSTAKRLHQENRSQTPTDANAQNAPLKKSALLVTDSGYSDELAEKVGAFTSANWDTLEVTNTEELQERIGNKKGLKHMDKYQTIVLLLGAKDICIGGRTAADVLKIVTGICTTISNRGKSKVYLCDIPPVQPDDHLPVISCLNYDYEDYACKQNISHIKTGDFFTLAKSKTLQAASNKLSQRGVAFFLEAMKTVEVTERVEEETSDEEEEEEDRPGPTRSVMPITEEAYKQLTGTNGQTISSMEDKTKTDIQKIRWRENRNNMQGFLIVGKKEEVSAAKVLIAKASTNKNEDRKRKAVCRYFQTPSGCNNGGYCAFQHTKKPKRY